MIPQVAIGVLVDALSGRVLIAFRGPACPFFQYVWEWPGGKAEQGEEPIEALVRELQEELGVTPVKIMNPPVASVVWTFDDNHVQLNFYMVTEWEGAPIPQDDKILEVRWVTLKEIESLPFMPTGLAVLPFFRHVLNP